MTRSLGALFLMIGLFLLSSCRPGLDRDSLLHFFQQNSAPSENGGGAQGTGPISVSPREGGAPSVPAVPAPAAPESGARGPVVPGPVVPGPVVPGPVVPGPVVPGPVVPGPVVPGPVVPGPVMPPPVPGKVPFPAQIPPIADLPPVVPPPPLPVPGPASVPPSGRHEGSTEDSIRTPVTISGNERVLGSALGESCRSMSSRNLCLGMNYFVFVNSDSMDFKDEAESLLQLEGINQIWNECGIQFQIDHYTAVNPAQYSLRLETTEFSELNEIRERFSDDSSLLVVVTGKWGRSGSLGESPAQAWTTLPGQGLYGAILNRSVGGSSALLAHELGHYLSLTHVDDSSQLMNPVIYPASVRITLEQCEQARWAVDQYWKKMLR